MIDKWLGILDTGYGGKAYWKLIKSLWLKGYKNEILYQVLKKKIEFNLRICRDIRLFTNSAQTQLTRRAFFKESSVKIFIYRVKNFVFISMFPAWFFDIICLLKHRAWFSWHETCISFLLPSQKTIWEINEKEWHMVSGHPTCNSLTLSL